MLTSIKYIKYSLTLTGLLSIVSCGGNSTSKQLDTSSPVFTSPSSFSIEENTTTVTSVKATDNSTVTYSISGGSDKAKFQINDIHGSLFFISAPDFDNPADRDKNNIFIVEITATDSSDNKSSQTITIQITKVDTTNPVFISGNTASIIEGQVKVLTVKATDESSISYSITGGLDASQFKINTTTGDLEFKNAPNFESPTDHGNDNSYSVEVAATDATGNRSKQLITITIIDDVVNLSESSSARSLGRGFNSTSIVNLGSTPKSLYALFTNNNHENPNSPTIKHKSFKKSASLKESSKIVRTDSNQTPQGLHAPAHIRSFNQTSKHLLKISDELSPKQRITSQKMEVTAGDKRTFTTDIYYDIPSNTEHEVGDIKQTTEATARLVRTVNTVFGPKTLNMWVSDDSYGTSSTDCTKYENIAEDNSFCITYDLVEELADKFLKNDPNSTAKQSRGSHCGEEWGDTPFSDLISDTDEITLLLTDIDQDSNPRGGVIGFFSSVNNFSKSTYKGSNEEVMFYLDSVMYGNYKSGDETFKKLIFATLAHEFTHMLEYYQKDVLLSLANNSQITSDTWLAEMTAEATEYLTSRSAQHNSPRGIHFDDGTDGTASLTAPEKILIDRFPDFNKYNNTYSLTSFNNTVQEYSKVSAFGAFLMNNYGGPELLHDIVHSTEVDENAVIAAVNKFKGSSNITFGDLLRDWGIAVLLSDIVNFETDKPVFNTGGFTTTSFNGIDYDIGSINFFNYVTGSDAQNVFDFGPTIRTTPITEESPVQVQPHGNFYYKIGDNLTGSIEITFEADSDTEITLIAK